MGQRSAQDWVSPLYQSKWYLSFPALPCFDVFPHDAFQFSVQRFCTVIGAGDSVDGAADPPLEGEFRQPVGQRGF